MSKKAARLKDIRQIRSIMERSTTFLSLNGISGVLSGALAITAAGLVAARTGSILVDPVKLGALFGQPSFTAFFLLVFGCVLILAILIAALFSARTAGRLRIPIWNSSSRRFCFALFIPVATGGLILAALFIQGHYAYFFPLTLVFYGLGLISASVHTLPETRTLGLGVLALGAAAMFWLPGGFILWSAGFGILNIVYGLLMTRKYGP